MDNDDAPELTDEFFEKADKYVDGKLVPREPEDDLTVVYLWARKEAEDEIKALRSEIERLRDALRAIETISDCHENARQIARAALGEDKPLEERWDD